MSVSASSRVWDYSRAEGTELLVLLALADWANDKNAAWYGLAAIARRARCSIRHAQNCVRSLANRGEILVKYGAGPHGTNVYYVLCRPEQGFTPKSLRGEICDNPPHDPEQGFTPKPASSRNPLTPDFTLTIIKPEEPAAAFAEVPDEREVQREAEGYAGNLAKGVPPKMPERWWRCWMIARLGKVAFNWTNWRQIMRLSFESDFGAGMPQALGTCLPEKKTGGANAAGDSGLEPGELLQRLEMENGRKKP